MEIIELRNFDHRRAGKFLLQLLDLRSISHVGTWVRVARCLADLSRALCPDT